MGLVLSIVLVFLILMAQFASFVDPFIILLAIPPGISGVILFLLLTHTTINIMSLMGVLMMTGIVVSDSILIVEFTGQLRAARAEAGRGHHHRLQGASATDSDDHAGDGARADPDGAGDRSGQRTVCAPGPRDSWRPYGLWDRHRLPRAERLPADPPAHRSSPRRERSSIRRSIPRERR